MRHPAPHQIVAAEWPWQTEATRCCMWQSEASFLANLWQTALRAKVGDALRLVELPRSEPLTPCMPLTSQPLASQRASTRCLISVLLSTQIAIKRHGAGCGEVRLGCWQIAGTLASNNQHHHRPGPPKQHRWRRAVLRRLRVERRATGDAFRYGERLDGAGLVAASRGTVSQWILLILSL
jgi:hypothetical protein